MHVALILLCCSFLQRLGDRPMTVASFPSPFLVHFCPALGLSVLPTLVFRASPSSVFARFWSTASCRSSSFLTVSPPLLVLKAEFSLDKGSRPFCKICPDCLCMLPRCCCAAECVSASHFFSTSSSMIGSQARGPPSSTLSPLFEYLWVPRSLACSRRCSISASRPLLRSASAHSTLSFLSCPDSSPPDARHRAAAYCFLLRLASCSGWFGTTRLRVFFHSHTQTPSPARSSSGSSSITCCSFGIDRA